MAAENPWTLANLSIAAAQSAVALSPGMTGIDKYRGVTLQANFTYGSGGTNATAYVQSTLDGGVTWFDVAAFQFTTASAIKLANVRRTTPVTTIVAATDGSLTANTVVDGLLGDQLRVKWASTGTYAGTTTLLITAVGG
jgi:hypothetical protein